MQFLTLKSPNIILHTFSVVSEKSFVIKVAGYTRCVSPKINNLISTKTMQLKLTEKEAYNYCQETMTIKNQIEIGYMEVAKRLYTIKTQRLYEPYGSWDLFLDEARIHPSKGNQLVRVYEKFIVQNGLKAEDVVKAGGYTVAVALLPMAKTPEMAKNALEHASMLPLRQNVRDWVKEAVNDDFKACEHKETYSLEICRCCGERFKIAEKQEN